MKKLRFAVIALALVAFLVPARPAKAYGDIYWNCVAICVDWLTDCHLICLDIWGTAQDGDDCYEECWWTYNQCRTYCTFTYGGPVV